MNRILSVFCTALVVVVSSAGLTQDWSQHDFGPEHRRQASSLGPMTTDTLSIYPAGQGLGSVFFSTPVHGNGRFYFIGSNGYAYAYDAATYSPVWTRNLQAPGVGLAYTDGMLIAVTSNSVEGLNPLTGNNNWSPVLGPQTAAPTVKGDQLYVLSDDSLFARNRLSGARLWAQKLATSSVGAAVSVMSDGKVVVVTQPVSGSEIARVAIFSPTGSLIRETGIAGSGYYVQYSPVITEQFEIALITYGDAFSSSYTVLLDSALTPKFIKKYSKAQVQGPISLDQSGRLISASLNIGTVYFATNGNKGWLNQSRQDIVSSNPVAIDNNGNVYLAAGDSVFCYNQGGGILWSKFLGPMNGGASLNDGKLYLAGENRIVVIGDTYTVPTGVHVAWEKQSLSTTTSATDTLWISFVSGVTDLNIIAYQDTVRFDSMVVKVIGATSVGTVSEPWGMPTVNLTVPGQVIVGGFGTDPLIGSGRLVGIVVEVVGLQGSSSTVCMSGNMRLNGGGVDANVPALCMTVSVSNELQISGSTFYGFTPVTLDSVTVTLSGSDDQVDSTGTDGSYSFTVANGSYATSTSRSSTTGYVFDCFFAAKVAQYVAGTGTLTETEKMAADVNLDGAIGLFDAALICRHAIGLPPFDDTDKTGKWIPEPSMYSYTNLDADSTGQDFNLFLLGYVEELTSLQKRGVVSDSQVTFSEPVWWNDSLNVRTPVQSDGSSTPIAFSVDLKYNPSELEFVGATSALPGWQKEINNTRPGELVIGLYTTSTPLPIAATILDINWRVLTDSTAIIPVLIKVDRDEQKVDTLFIVKARSPVTGINDESGLPSEFFLAQNYPNPFNPSTSIRYELPRSVRVALKVYNLKGQEVATLVDGMETAGVHTLIWFPEGAASGVYLYRIKAGDFVGERRMLFVK